MGVVIDHLMALLKKQVDDHGLVVWFDPGGHYQAMVEALSLPDTRVCRYEGSYFALRKVVESFMGGLEPPRLVIYVPKDQADTHHALEELVAAGVVMKPGQQPPARNTRPSIVVRHALARVFPTDTAQQLADQVEAGKLTLEEVDRLAEKGAEVQTGVVTLIFKSGNPHDVALAFLASDKHDEEISRKGAKAELALLLGSALDVELPESETLEDLRARLARHLLLTEFLTTLKGPIPVSLSTIRLPLKPAIRQECLTLVQTWRNRRDLQASYAEHARRVEAELGLSRLDMGLLELASVETFPFVEERLQRLTEAALMEGVDPGLIEIAHRRQSTFWSERSPEVQARWALVAVAGQLLVEADRIEAELKNAPWGAQELIEKYTLGDAPWCLLDTYHRHLERRFQTFDLDLGGRHQTLEQLVVRARQRYTEVANRLAECFTQALAESHFKVAGVAAQRETFKSYVAPALATGKTAYVLVDALRFEMARELVQSLGDDFAATLIPAVGTPPTITEVGMAALMPEADREVTLVEAVDKRLALQVQGTVLKDRKDRVKFLHQRVQGKVFDTKLDALIPPKKAVREGIQGADLVFVTASEEIDKLCEAGNNALARRLMDDALIQLRRAFRVLSELGVKSIIVVADHGYLFGDELSSDMLIDRHGGHEMDLHRRVWMGKGGESSPSFLRVKASVFGLGGDLELAFPWTLAAFKVQGGARAYFHGGLSLQELIIPVISLTPRVVRPPILAAEIRWVLTPGSMKLSTRFFSVQVSGDAGDLLELVPPRVRVEIWAKGKPVSVPVSASYGFQEATGDVQLRLKPGARSIDPNTITLMLLEVPEQKMVSVHLLDATTGRELKRLEKIEVAISL